MSNNIKEDLSLFNELILDFLESEQKNPIAEYIKPENVKNIFDVKLGDKAIDSKEFKKNLYELLVKTPKSSSKLFFNQLYGGRHSKAVLGDLFAVFLNNSMATYKIAGPQVCIEKEILSKIHTLIGYNKNLAGGSIPTGGSMCNFMSLIMARDKMCCNTTNTLQKLIVYTSENGHYSVTKNTSFAGIGTKNVRYLKTDSFGKIDIVEFEKQVEKDIKTGFTPFYLNATAGTTVLCAFDDVLKLAPICKKHNIWLHLDGAFGGSVIFSDKYKFLVEGVSLTDSFCFNAHKTLGTPISTSILTVRNKKYLYKSFDNDADYLYQTHEKKFNLGRTSFECGRRNNALKLWTLWKSIGKDGIANIVDHEFKLADVARNYIINNGDYKLYSFKDSLSVCFNYKNFDPEDLCTKLYEQNILMIGFGYFKKEKFVRLVTINGHNSIGDILNVFKIIENFTAEHKNSLKTI